MLHSCLLSAGGDGGLSLSGPQGPVRRTPGRFILCLVPNRRPEERPKLHEPRLGFHAFRRLSCVPVGIFPPVRLQLRSFRLGLSTLVL